MSENENPIATHPRAAYYLAYWFGSDQQVVLVVQVEQILQQVPGPAGVASHLAVLVDQRVAHTEIDALQQGGGEQCDQRIDHVHLVLKIKHCNYNIFIYLFSSTHFSQMKLNYALNYSAKIKILSKGNFC